jgi:hypothetical protein
VYSNDYLIEYEAEMFHTTRSKSIVHVYEVGSDWHGSSDQKQRRQCEGFKKLG